MENIIKKIKEVYSVSDETLALLSSHLTPCAFPRKHLLIEEGRRSKVAYFIEKGLTRSFWIVNGEQATTSFSSEGDIVFSMDELYYNKTSEEYVETLEEVQAYKIPLPELRDLFETNLELCNWGRIIHQNEYRRLHRTHKDVLTLSAKERYEEMKIQFPDMCNRVNLGFIASYLGITLSTLSRVRSNGGW